MSRLFPIRSPVEREAEEPRVLAVDDEDADEVFSALSSDTARTILQLLYAEPRTASDLADHVDTSLQNVRYHLEKLRDAGLVEVADTWYSERGTEMKVYAPASESVVVFAGEDDGGTLRTLLRQLVGGVGVLAMGSVAVEYLARTYGTPEVGAGDGGGAGAPTGGDGAGSGAPTSTEAPSAGGGAPATTAAGGGTDAGGERTAAETAAGGTSIDSSSGDVTPGTGVAGTNAEGTTAAAGTRVGATNGDPTTATDGGTTNAVVPDSTTGETGATTAADLATDTAAATTSAVNESLGGGDGTTVADTAPEGVAAVEGAVGLPPGALFFLGGALMLAVLLGYQYLAR